MKFKESRPRYIFTVESRPRYIFTVGLGLNYQVKKLDKFESQPCLFPAGIYKEIPIYCMGGGALNDFWRGRDARWFLYLHYVVEKRSKAVLNVGLKNIRINGIVQSNLCTICNRVLHNTKIKHYLKGLCRFIFKRSSMHARFTRVLI